jgi:hypothetical protein
MSWGTFTRFLNYVLLNYFTPVSDLQAIRHPQRGPGVGGQTAFGRYPKEPREEEHFWILGIHVWSSIGPPSPQNEVLIHPLNLMTLSSSVVYFH